MGGLPLLQLGKDKKAGWKTIIRHAIIGLGADSNPGICIRHMAYGFPAPPNELNWCSCIHNFLKVEGCKEKNSN